METMKIAPAAAQLRPEDKFARVAPMLVASLAAAAFVVPSLRAPPRVARHPHPVARQLAFVAKAEHGSPPFAEGRDVAAWFAEESALQVLMSQADACERLDKGEMAGEQRWEVTTGIPFPGMVAKSATAMNVKINTATPALQISSSESKTVCEGGPGWARAFLSRISEIASTTSTNVVELRDAPGGKVFVSTVSLTVALTLPPFLPVPVAAFEKAGSESIQKLLDQDMPPTLSKFRDAYLAWEA
jgi:hypothetical protein